MKRLILFSSVVVAVILVVSWNYWKADPRGPIYYGKPVVEWALDLNSPSLKVRQEATTNIATFDADALPTPPSCSLADPDPVFAHMVRLVGWHAPQKVTRSLFRMANPYDAPMKRAAAAQALRLMGTRAAPALPALTRALEDDKTVSWHAALALSQFGEDGVKALTGKLDAASPAQAGFICYALSTMGRTASNAAPALVRQLGAKDSNVVERAGTALGAIGPAAIPALQHVLTTPGSDAHLVAIHALSQMGPVARQAIPELLLCVRSAMQGNERRPQKLGQIQPTSPTVVAALTTALGDNAGPVRLQALEGLSRSPATARQAEAAIQQALNDESYDPRARDQPAFANCRGAGAGRADGRKRLETNQRSKP